MQGVGDGSGGCQRSPKYGNKDLHEAGSRQGRDDSEGTAPKTREEKVQEKKRPWPAVLTNAVTMKGDPRTRPQK